MSDWRKHDVQQENRTAEFRDAQPQVQNQRDNQWAPTNFQKQQKRFGVGNHNGGDTVGQEDYRATSVGFGNGSLPFPQQPQPSPGSNGESRPRRHLTFEENQVLKQCGNEAKLYRGLPFAIGTCAGMIYLRNKGYVQPKLFWLKASALAGFSYFAGMTSYLSVCRERIMKLPNSPLGEQLRKASGGETVAESEIMPNTSSGDMGSIPGFRHDDGAFPGMVHEGTDSMATQNLQEGSSSRSPMQSGTATYDELRRKHREAFVRTMRPSGFPVSPPQPDDHRFRAGDSDRPQPQFGKYGDTSFSKAT